MAFHNKNAVRKYQKIQQAYFRLYEEGLRFEVCVNRLAERFDLSRSRIEQILRMEIK